jgi:hypothetical protein
MTVVAHVQGTGGCPRSRQRSSHGHPGSAGLWSVAPARVSPAESLPPRRSGSRRSTLTTPRQQPPSRQRRGHHRGRDAAPTAHCRRARRRPSDPAMASSPAEPDGALNVDDSTHPKPPRPHNHANARKAPTSASKPPNPINAGNPTSPTGPWPTAATSRSSTGSMTIRDICSTAPPTVESAVATSWPASPTPPQPTACLPPP